MAYVQGVKYLKISKTDARGEDRSSTLRQLTNIRLKYSDIGIKQYNIQSIQEFSTYFLYSINFQDIASSADKGIYNYASTAAYTGPTTTIDDVYPVAIEGYTTITVPNSRFNQSQGTYQLDTVQNEHNPNAVLQLTASIQYTPDGGSPSPRLSVIVKDTLSPLLTVGADLVGSSGTLTLTASIADTSSLWNMLVNERQPIQLAVWNDASTTGVIFSNATFIVTQSQAFTNTSSILTVPSPNTIKKFESTDCDVTYGWVDQYPTSQYYMDIDYSYGITVPVNQSALVSGTAVLAPVKDYYYNLHAQTLPRYQGSRVSQYELNKYTGPNSNIPVNGSPYTGDTGYGKSPNVELNQAYFAWFSEVYGASPEYNDAVNVAVKYLVDPLGNTYSPGLTKYFQGEIINNFTQGQTAELNFIDANGGTNSTPTAIKTALNGTRKIIRPGVKASAVLYTQTGSSANAYTQSLQFTTIQDGSAYKTLLDYRFGAQQYGTQTITAGSGVQKIQFGTTLWDFQSGYDATQFKYTFPSTPESKIRFQINLGEVRGSNTSTAIVVRKNGVNIYRELITFGVSDILYDKTIVTDYYNFSSSDYVEIFAEKGANSFTIAQNGTSVQWLAEQQLLAQQVVPSITAPFFYTSSANPYILTASLQFSSSINQVYQVALSGSGFDSVRYKVSFEPGDQLRFENNELNTYTINKIISSSTQSGNGETYMLLDQPVTNGTNTDYFVLRRFAPDPSNVIVEGIKPSGGTGAGTLTPLYISPQLENDMANIVSKLNSENTI